MLHAKSVCRSTLIVFMPALAVIMMIPHLATAVLRGSVVGLMSIYVPILVAELLCLTAGYAVGLLASRTEIPPSKASTVMASLAATVLLLLISAFTQATRVGRQMFYHSAFSNWWAGREIIIAAICLVIGVVVGLAAGERSKLRTAPLPA